MLEMTAASTSRHWLRNLHTLVACLAIVMLGGTRVLDFSSYKSAYNYLKAVHAADANNFEPASVEELLNTVYTWILPPVLSSVEDPQIQTRHEMPLQLLLEQEAHSTVEATVFDRITVALLYWQADVPTPPPRA